jgi:hypothetical protein
LIAASIALVRAVHLLFERTALRWLRVNSDRRKLHIEIGGISIARASLLPMTN